MKHVMITDANGAEVERHPIDNDQIKRACHLTCEIHNRDNPDAGWQVSVEDDEAAAAVAPDE